MELKEYQSRVLDAFGRWLEATREAEQESSKGIEALRSAGVAVPEEISNYPRNAWMALKGSGSVAESAGDYVDRRDEAERPIPHVCFKIPTGGGKTLLAAAALERLNRPTGLTLWIVPSTAIYQQTKAALWNREHPYRQMLERASGGRLKMLEKDDPFTASDIAHFMCVMLVSMQSANHKNNKNFLRMFRDSGRYPTLFPDSDDALADSRLLERYPDLRRTSTDGPISHSLLNVFKMHRPVIVLDEAHKAYGTFAEASDRLMNWVGQLDPSLVIELSATPSRRKSNLLVDVSGVDLKAEEMIKLPVKVTSYISAEWKYTLTKSAEKLEELSKEAQSLQMSEGRYVRPIAVVRVERTGKDQLDKENVHAEDVRKYLIQNLSAPPDSIRVKSADNDELGRENLLSEESPVRWIITKSALMEGWDCPFAYLLVMLDNTRAQRAITQLVGRVMRQPHARRTGRETLDQCYVYCCNTDVGLAVQQVKNGLEHEGLTGLGDDVRSDQHLNMQRVPVLRREQFRGLDIFLPRVLHSDGDGWCELDYQKHILVEVDWDAIQAPNPQSTIHEGPRMQLASVDVGEAQPVFDPPQELQIDKTIQVSYFARRISDIVPNPWQAARIVQDLLRQLREAGESEDDTYDRRFYLGDSLWRHVILEVEKQGEKIFRDKLFKSNKIQFNLESSEANYRMVDSYEIPATADDPALLNYGRPLQLSLFEPLFERQFDTILERSFARYIDERRALRWWHRIGVRQHQEYYLRGWKRDRIYPDFIAMAGETYGKPHLLVFETKGEHLRDNPDTKYKQKVFETLERAFNVGKITLRDGPAKGTFRLLFNEMEFPEALARLEGRA